MNRRVKWGVGLGLIVAVGGGLVWWGSRPAPQTAVGHPRHPPAINHPHPKPHPNKARSASFAPLGTVAWAAQMQTELSRQWGVGAPPLWIAPDPSKTHAWFVLAPLAHKGALWWAVATPKDPLPTLQAVSTTLNLSTGQVAALPKPIQGVLTQAYDLLHDRLWALTQQVPPIQSSGAMTATQAEARGVAQDPIAWSVIWEPPIPALAGQKAQPGATNFVVTMPWHASGQPAVLMSESMEIQTTGHLVSGGDVTISMNGTTRQPLPVTDTAALVPGSVKAGLSSP